MVFGWVYFLFGLFGALELVWIVRHYRRLLLVQNLKYLELQSFLAFFLVYFYELSGTSGALIISEFFKTLDKILLSYLESPGAVIMSSVSWIEKQLYDSIRVLSFFIFRQLE